MRNHKALSLVRLFVVLVAALVWCAGTALGSATPQEKPADQAPQQQGAAPASPASPASGQQGSAQSPIYAVGKGVSPPKPIYQPEPPYTDQARKACVQGVVLLSLVVDADGNVSDAQVTQSLEPSLDESAVDTVRTWRFEPARRDGAPVAVRVTVETSFRMFPCKLPDNGVFFRPRKDGTPPQPISTPDPEYTPQARQAHLEGTVVLALVVDRKGRVTNVMEIGPRLGMGLDEKALKTARKWKYHPAVNNGVPVPARIKVEVKFHL